MKAVWLILSWNHDHTCGLLRNPHFLSLSHCEALAPRWSFNFVSSSLDLEVYQTQIAPSPCAMSSQPMRNSGNKNIAERSKSPTSSLAPLHFKVTSLPSLPILDIPATQDPWPHWTSWSTCVRYKNVVASLCCEGRQVIRIYFEEKPQHGRPLCRAS